MILADKTIRKYLVEGKIQITPQITPEDVRPAGVRVHLSEEILIPKPNQTVNLSSSAINRELEYEKINIKNNPYTLKPNDFILAASNEKIHTTKDILTVLDGRSTIARLGLTTHITAGVLDGIMYGPQSPVLEIKNVGVFDIIINYLDPIALICFYKLSEPVESEELPKYAAQANVEVPQLVRDWDTIPN